MTTPLLEITTQSRKLGRAGIQEFQGLVDAALRPRSGHVFRGHDRRRERHI